MAVHPLARQHHSWKARRLACNCLHRVKIGHIHQVSGWVGGPAAAASNSKVPSVASCLPHRRTSRAKGRAFVVIAALGESSGSQAVVFGARQPHVGAAGSKTNSRASRMSLPASRPSKSSRAQHTAVGCTPGSDNQPTNSQRRFSYKQWQGFQCSERLNKPLKKHVGKNHHLTMQGVQHKQGYPVTATNGLRQGANSNQAFVQHEAQGQQQQYLQERRQQPMQEQLRESYQQQQEPPERHAQRPKHVQQHLQQEQQERQLPWQEQRKWQQVQLQQQQSRQEQPEHQHQQGYWQPRQPQHSQPLQAQQQQQSQQLQGRQQMAHWQHVEQQLEAPQQQQQRQPQWPQEAHQQQQHLLAPQPFKEQLQQLLPHQGQQSAQQSQPLQQHHQQQQPPTWQQQQFLKQHQAPKQWPQQAPPQSWRQHQQPSSMQQQKPKQWQHDGWQQPLKQPHQLQQQQSVKLHSQQQLQQEHQQQAEHSQQQQQRIELQQQQQHHQLGPQPWQSVPLPKPRFEQVARHSACWLSYCMQPQQELEAMAQPLQVSLIVPNVAKHEQLHLTAAPEAQQESRNGAPAVEVPLIMQSRAAEGDQQQVVSAQLQLDSPPIEQQQQKQQQLLPSTSMRVPLSEGGLEHLISHAPSVSHATEPQQRPSQPAQMPLAAPDSMQQQQLTADDQQLLDQVESTQQQSRQTWTAAATASASSMQLDQPAVSGSRHINNANGISSNEHTVADDAAVSAAAQVNGDMFQQVKAASTAAAAALQAAQQLLAAAKQGSTLGNSNSTNGSSSSSISSNAPHRAKPVRPGASSNPALAQKPQWPSSSNNSPQHAAASPQHIDRVSSSSSSSVTAASRTASSTGEASKYGTVCSTTSNTSQSSSAPEVATAPAGFLHSTSSHAPAPSDVRYRLAPSWCKAYKAAGVLVYDYDDSNPSDIRMLLVREKRQQWNMFAGKKDEQVDVPGCPESTASRELEEESHGLIPAAVTKELLPSCPKHWWGPGRMILYFMRYKGGAALPDMLAARLAAGWLSPAAQGLDQLTWVSLKQLIAVQKGKTISGKPVAARASAQAAMQAAWQASAAAAAKKAAGSGEAAQEQLTAVLSAGLRAENRSVSDSAGASAASAADAPQELLFHRWVAHLLDQQQQQRLKEPLTAGQQQAAQQTYLQAHELQQMTLRPPLHACCNTIARWLPQLAAGVAPAPGLEMFTTANQQQNNVGRSIGSAAAYGLPAAATAAEAISLVSEEPVAGAASPLEASYAGNNTSEAAAAAAAGSSLHPEDLTSLPQTLNSDGTELPGDSSSSQQPVHQKQQAGQRLQQQQGKQRHQQLQQLLNVPTVRVLN